MSSCTIYKKIKLIFLIFFGFSFLPSFALQEKHPKICMVLDKGGKDDHSFNESAVIGFQKASKEFSLSKESKFVEPKSDVQISQSIRAFASSANCDLIVTIGFNPAEHLLDIAAKYPHKKFLAVDVNLEDRNKAKNIRSITFQEHEGSFLVGAIAALSSKTDKIGFVGGMDVPLIHRFETGYSSGAKYVRPSIKIVSSYIGVTPDAWNNPAKAKELALAQYHEGIDIIFQVAANSGLGVFDSAEQMNKKQNTIQKKYFAIGVDSNQNWLKPGVILTSMIKRVDNAVYRTIQDFIQNKFKAEHIAYSLRDGGVDWAYDKHNKHFFTDSQLNEINSIKEKIIKGKIIVPDYFVIEKK